MRGYGVVSRYLKRFLEMHGYNVHLGAWVDVKIGSRLVLDLQVGHWYFHRPPKRGAPSALYVFTEGRIDRRAREWLLGYDYIFAPTKFVAEELEKIDVPYIMMWLGIDTELFKPLPIAKFIDVLSIGIWESTWDDRKFMNRVTDVAFPYTHYVHTRPTLPYDMLPELYNASRLYVSLSACEGGNIPVLEANACGIPAVFNKACGTKDLAFGVGVEPIGFEEKVDRGVPFYIYKPNIPKIREVVHMLLRDEKKLEILGARAREHALRFDFRKTFKPLLEVLPRI